MTDEQNKPCFCAPPRERKVRVDIRTSEYPADFPLEPIMWECWIVTKLKLAGIPIKRYGEVESGTLTRYEDPEDFSNTVYEWYSTRT